MSFSQKNHFSAGHKFAFQNFWFEKEKKLFYNKRGVKKSTSIGGCQDCGEKLGKKKMGLKSVSELRHQKLISFVAFTSDAQQAGQTLLLGRG